MSWSTPSQLRAGLLKQWERGKFYKALVNGEELFPLRVSLKKPTSSELGARFAEVRDWIATLSQGDYRVELKVVNHRVIGSNEIPVAVWLDSLEQLAGFVRKSSELQRFRRLLALTQEQDPELVPWLGRRASQVLELEEAWPTLLRTVDWMKRNPRPGIYTRQLDLEGVHTKFIEQHRKVLQQMFELALAPEAVDEQETDFEKRFGFLTRPPRVRLRFLDPAANPLLPYSEVTLRAAELAALDPPVRQVFVVENEVTFLAFPEIAESLLLFGSGFSVELLAQLPWLKGLPIYYWGDIDTYGFAILDRLRAAHPQTVSFLMDRATLLQHRPRWVTENSQALRELPHLTEDEQELYQDLLDQFPGYLVRLEQELIGFGWVLDALGRIGFAPGVR